LIHTSYIGLFLNYFNFYFVDYSHADKLHKILCVKLKSLGNNGGHVYANMCALARGVFKKLPLYEIISRDLTRIAQFKCIRGYLTES